MVLTILISFLLLILFPSDVLAWGAGVHLEVGSHLLVNLRTLPEPLSALLAAYPRDFLYGCIGADITVGKKFTHYLKHCHSWRVGRQLLDAAVSEGQQACAYGYLAHLAADTVAHSYFVPYKMVRTFNSGMLHHAYWELRVEADIEPEVWELARQVAMENFRENDILLRNVLSTTLFSFTTNKRIFNSMLLLNRLRQWQRMLRAISARSRWTLEEENRGEYIALAREAATSILVHLEESPWWSADPTGERAMHAAKSLRKHLKKRWLQGKLPPQTADRLLADIKNRLRLGIITPEQLPEMLNELG